jgi:uncharacterized membrane protein
MASGDSQQGALHSPIVRAIAEAEVGTTSEIRVHLSKRLFEKDAYARACHLFSQYGMSRTTQRNAVLLYINLRHHKAAIVADEGAHHALGQRFYEAWMRELGANLRGTHPERAVAMSVLDLGKELGKHFPAGAE